MPSPTAYVLLCLALAAIGYTYIIYPVLLLVLRRLRPRPVEKSDSTPSVSLIITAHNEAAVIASKLDNTLALDYPGDRLQVLVASDGSTDGTDAIVASYRARGVDLVRSPDRVGKTRAQNLAAAGARGEILVFSDASTSLEKGALRAIVAPFADPKVGLVSGEDVPGVSFQHAAAPGEGLYVRYEMRLRQLESATGSLVGASGCFYAARRSLRGELVGGLVEDFALPLHVLRSGHRVVAEPAARALVPSTSSVSAEFRRRVRIQIGGTVALWHYRRLLNPIRFPQVSWRLLSHKIARWLVPAWLAVLFGNSAAMSRVSVVCAVLCALQIACYALALAGWILSGRNRLPAWVSVPFSFLLAHVAITVGLAQAMLGRRAETWQPSDRSVTRPVS